MSAQNKLRFHGVCTCHELTCTTSVRAGSCTCYTPRASCNLWSGTGWLQEISMMMVSIRPKADTVGQSLEDTSPSGTNGARQTVLPDKNNKQAVQTKRRTHEVSSRFSSLPCTAKTLTHPFDFLERVGSRWTDRMHVI